MIKKIKDKLKWAFTTKMGLTVSSVCWVLLWAVIHKITDSDWTYNMMIPGVLSVIGIVILMIANAWIINPIKKAINKNKK